jgi:hypothetical protein
MLQIDHVTFVELCQSSEGGQEGGCQMCPHPRLCHRHQQRVLDSMAPSCAPLLTRAVTVAFATAATTNSLLGGGVSRDSWEPFTRRWDAVARLSAPSVRFEPTHFGGALGRLKGSSLSGVARYTDFSVVPLVLLRPVFVPFDEGWPGVIPRC